jgi:hypothetical protein
MLAARHKLPAVYWERFFATAGGLMSNGPPQLDQYTRAAGYADRAIGANQSERFSLRKTSEGAAAPPMNAMKSRRFTA